MKAKQLSVAVTILLLLTFVVGCGTQRLFKDNFTTTASSADKSTTSDTPIAGRPTADCVSTTPSDKRTQPTQTNAMSTTTGILTISTDTTSTICGVSTTSTDSTSTLASLTTTSAGITLTSGSISSTSVKTTATTAPPTSHTLIPLTSSSYYGLSKLKNLPNSGVLTEAYETIVEAIENCETTVAMNEKLTESELLTVFYYYHADYPQHFWCDGKIRYAVSGRSDKVTQVQFHYTMTGEKLRQAQSKFNSVVKSVLNLAATGNNEYERELLLHDALAKRVTYQDGENAHNAYGALVTGKAVCEGYARAFQYLLYQSGIQCLIAEGSSINPSTGLYEGHAWNIVRIDNQYYHVDPTWDDVDDTDIPVMYPYFNLTTEQISEDHTMSQTNSYFLPYCIATAANYHVKNGTRLTTYTVDGVSALLKNNDMGVHLYCVNGIETFVGWFKNNHKTVIQAMGIDRGYSYKLLYTGKEVVVRLTII